MNQSTLEAPMDVAPSRAPAADHEVIPTRFGDLVADPEKIIRFERGLYGFEHQRNFFLAQVPGWPDFFQLLQAIDDPSLGLIVMPLDGDDGPIQPADFKNACATLGYDPEVTTAIGIVTMREDHNSQVFTVNLKAPLLIDSRQRAGRQHVFAGEHYPLRHPLQANDPSEG
jgi:flagellar assembly factor FliW